MKVYFVGGQYMGCNYVRILLPMWENGWQGNIIDLKRPTKPAHIVAKEMADADVVVFHRPELLQHHKLGMILKNQGKKIVFDNDDSFKFDEFHPFFNLDTAENFEKNVEAKNNLINNFVLNSDLITTTTQHLADEYSEINKNVRVLKNCVQPEDWDEPLRNEGDKVRIGFVGSVVYAHDFDIIRDTIKALHDREDVQIVAFGHSKLHSDDARLDKTILRKDYEFWESLDKLEHMPWVPMHEYPKKLNEMRLDMMLIPRRENSFNRAKSNVKFLEAAMCEIPVVASSFLDGKSPYDADIDGTNGVLVPQDAEWLPYVEELIENKEKRRSLGKAARKYVLENYDIKDYAHEWVEAYQSLF